MKSRISSCERTAFKKYMTRFLPAWALYGICLLLGMILLRDGDRNAWFFHRHLAQLTSIMGPINLCYALLTAQLLFGDLYNARMCNAIHALPVTREGLFRSQVGAGLLMSLIPTVPAVFLALLLGIGSPVENGWHLCLYWLLCANGQYLFFFGLSAFSAMCAGNRLAQGVIYCILNFASIVVYWLADTLYVPLLYGVRVEIEPFALFSPVVWFVNSGYVTVEREVSEGITHSAWYTLSDGWGYLAICALIGCVLLALAALLYRRRKLECAGDFMSLRALEPAFLTVYPLVLASLLYYVCDEVFASGIAVVYLIAGLLLGYITGEMLLRRSMRVFTGKCFVRCGILLAAFGISVGITALDPLGIENRMPDAQDVALVQVAPNYGYYYDDSVYLDDPEDIADILRVHEIALANREGGYDFEASTTDDGTSVRVHNYEYITLHYQLKNGKTLSRYYQVDLMGEAGDLVIPKFNTLDAIFRCYSGDQSFEGILRATESVDIRCDAYTGTKYYDHEDNNYITVYDPQDIRGLLEAIVRDCRENTMAQNWNYRENPEVSSAYWLVFRMGSFNEEITVYADSVHTCAWLRDNGFISEYQPEPALVQ